MAKVTALVNFTDRDSTNHAFGEEFDLPRETDEQKAEYDRLLAEGVVTTSSKPATEVVAGRTRS